MGFDVLVFECHIYLVFVFAYRPLQIQVLDPTPHSFAYPTRLVKCKGVIATYFS